MPRVQPTLAERRLTLAPAALPPGKLFAACDEGDEDAVRALAPGAAAHLNTWGPDSDTLLHTAAVYGFDAIVEELLRLGADPSVVDDNAGTPLVRLALQLCSDVAQPECLPFARAQHDASAGGYISIVRRLLAAQPALALVEDGDQETALVRAVVCVARRASVLCKCVAALSCMHACSVLQHCAARGGHPEVVAALLAAGADKAHVNAEGKTPLGCVDADDTATTAALA